jgi:hypothetical protein
MKSGLGAKDIEDVVAPALRPAQTMAPGSQGLLSLGFRCSRFRVPLLLSRFQVPLFCFSRFLVPLFASPGSAFYFSRLPGFAFGYAVASRRFAFPGYGLLATGYQ